VDLFDLTVDGQLSFKTAPDIEYPTDVGGDNQYDIIVRISDGVDTTEQAITVLPGGCDFYVIPASNASTVIICI
jgi:hypothetical protein